MIEPELLKKYANLLKAYTDIFRIQPISDEALTKFLIQVSEPHKSDSIRVYRALTPEEIEVLKLDVSCMLAWQAIAMDALEVAEKFFKKRGAQGFDVIAHPACLLFRQTFPVSPFGDIGVCVLISAHIEALESGAIEKTERLYVGCPNDVLTLLITSAEEKKKEEASEADLLFAMYANSVRSGFDLEEWTPDEKDAQ